MGGANLRLRVPLLVTVSCPAVALLVQSKVMFSLPESLARVITKWFRRISNRLARQLALPIPFRLRQFIAGPFQLILPNVGLVPGMLCCLTVVVAGREDVDDSVPGRSTFETLPLTLI